MPFLSTIATTATAGAFITSNGTTVATYVVEDGRVIVTPSDVTRSVFKALSVATAAEVVASWVLAAA